MANNSENGTMERVAEKAALARDQVTVGIADAVNSGVDAAKAAKTVIDDKL
jgi:hypothetical protein